MREILAPLGLILLLFVVTVPSLAGDKSNWRAEGHDSRIDLIWPTSSDPSIRGYHVERAERRGGGFQRITASPTKLSVYSDFLGENGLTRFYRIVPVYRGKKNGQYSSVVGAQTRAMDADELITSVQEATFRYFWNYGHPVSGLARERLDSGDRCAVGGTGFGLMVIVVGIERGFISRRDGARRVQKIIRFLDTKAERFHGAWSHWLNGKTGKTLPFSKFDDGADLVETALLVQGLLTVRQYFDGSNTTENDIRQRATRMWEQVEWDWFFGDPPGRRLVWHWSPNHGFSKNLRIGGEFNEAMITYLLAITSPTHPIPPESYYNGWVFKPQNYKQNKSFYNIRQKVGKPKGGPLFFTHYPFLGFDPRKMKDRFTNYYESNRAISLIHQAHAIKNPNGYKGYSRFVWGLTSCDGPDGYSGNSPTRDHGTIAPTAALSAMPYTPKESTATLEYFYRELGDRLWGPFGFYDGFGTAHAKGIHLDELMRK